MAPAAEELATVCTIPAFTFSDSCDGVYGLALERAPRWAGIRTIPVPSSRTPIEFARGGSRRPDSGADGLRCWYFARPAQSDEPAPQEQRRQDKHATRTQGRSGGHGDDTVDVCRIVGANDGGIRTECHGSPEGRGCVRRHNLLLLSPRRSAAREEVGCARLTPA